MSCNWLGNCCSLWRVLTHIARKKTADRHTASHCAIDAKTIGSCLFEPEWTEHIKMNTSTKSQHSEILFVHEKKKSRTSSFYQKHFLFGSDSHSSFHAMCWPKCGSCFCWIHALSYTHPKSSDQKSEKHHFYQIIHHEVDCKLAKTLYPYNRVPRKSYFPLSQFLQFFKPCRPSLQEFWPGLMQIYLPLITGGEILSVMITRLSHKLRCLHTRSLIICSHTHRLCPNNSKQTWVRTTNNRLPQSSWQWWGWLCHEAY